MGAELFIVRHGETEGQSSIRYHGRTDVALSDLGRAQMRAAAAAMPSRDFTRVFASTMVRAIEGARLIAGADAPIVTLEEFAEVDFGLFEGLTAEEIRARYPEEFERWNRDRLDLGYAYPGGESRAGFRSRVERGLRRMLEQWGDDASGDGRALIVAHRGVIRTIIRALVGAEPIIELASIHILERAPRWRVRELDIVSHLEGIDSRAGG
ncbi:MAG: histidine phosphatase family protein [Candidatus Binataceae bacterium]|jgi:broad specificity phosphatase PhoE